MNIKIQSIHFSADQKLEDFIQSKVVKLGQFSDRIIGAEVHLTLGRSQHPNVDSKVAKIKLDIPGAELFAEKTGASFEEATDQAVEALHKQLLKHKDKQVKH